jgi:uncharacterized protein
VQRVTFDRRRIHFASRRTVSDSRKGALAMDSVDYPPHYLRGIELFNQCEFFESHEAWEELWQEDFGPSRKFYQGLIQAAVALHHFCNGNIRGAKKVYYGSCGYLAPYKPKHMGLDLDAFIAQLTSCFQEVIDSKEEFPQIEINADAIPEIHLDPPPG